MHSKSPLFAARRRLFKSFLANFRQGSGKPSENALQALTEGAFDVKCNQNNVFGRIISAPTPKNDVILTM